MKEYFIVNMDLREYLDPEVFGESRDLASVVDSFDGTLFALAVLLADGNGRGSGDLAHEGEPVGTWAGCRIAVATREPGVVPEDFFETARDISEDVLRVISRAEEDNTVMSVLESDSVFSRKWLRSLRGRAARMLRDSDSRRSMRLHMLEDLFHLFGVSAVLTPAAAANRLAQGLEATARELGCPQRYQVRALRWKTGEKRVPVPIPGGGAHEAVVNGVTELSCELVDASAPPRGFTVKFGRRGSSVEDIFEQAFPGLCLRRLGPTAAKE